jgi:hypothetical protein
LYTVIADLVSIAKSNMQNVREYEKRGRVRGECR